MNNQPNYRAWDIKTQDYPANAPIQEQIKFLLGFGILAPSGHNGQPWSFKILGNKLDIHIVKARALVKSDPPGKQLCLGIGCLIENLRIAADYYGFQAKTAYQTDMTGKQPIATMTFEKTRDYQPNPGHLVHYIAKRSSNRNKYGKEPPTENFRKKLQELPTGNAKIFLSLDEKINNEIADLTVDAQIAALENEDFRKELSEMMKPNLTKSKIGMPGFAYLLPLPISLITPWMIKKFNMSKVNKKADQSLLKNFTRAFITIAADKEDTATCLQTGQLFEKIWLLAEQAGLQCSPNAAPIQYPPSRQKLRVLLKTQLIPLAFMRVGYCLIDPPHTPRLNPEEVIIP